MDQVFASAGIEVQSGAATFYQAKDAGRTKMCVLLAD
jgi:hypothetical protein